MATEDDVPRPENAWEIPVFDTPEAAEDAARVAGYVDGLEDDPDPSPPAGEWHDVRRDGEG